MSEYSGPKVLIYDIEVSPNLGWFWSTGQSTIGSNQILRPGKIICLSYRFTHWPEGKVKNLRWREKKRNNRLSIPYSDQDLVERFYKVAQEADIIVGHNGDGFDKKWLNVRLAYYHHPTLSAVMTEDTLKQARKQFRLPSFRLDFLCKYFNLPGKLSTPTGLWERVVFDGCKESLNKMVEYCDNDVLILDQLYKRIWPYVDHKINMGTFNDEVDICPACGSNHRQKRGVSLTTQAKYQRYQCMNCGKFYRDGVNLLKSSSKHRGRS